MALSGSSFNSRNRRKRGQPDLFTTAFGAVFVLAFVSCVGLLLHFSSQPSDAGMRADVNVMPVDADEILVPIDTIQVGASLQPAMFRRELRSEDRITGDMIRAYDDLKGKYAKGVLVKSQPILKAALTDRQPIHILTAMLPKNYRAVALQVEQPLLDNVDGWAQPGTDVDVVWITRTFGKEVAAVLAGPVKVLAANKATEFSQTKEGNATDKLTTVTLLLTTRDAMRVSLAAMHGKISLGLRGLGDRKPTDAARPISNVTDEPAAPEAPKPIISVRVFDPRAKVGEIRQYDGAGNRLSDGSPS